MAQHSLYRRYRPRTFSEIRGQDHVVRALSAAVAAGTEGHSYLFSGPRGTGKTSMARLLAKALNCTNLGDGQPCGECENCEAIAAGTSYDLFELDAASNNGVDAMRDLIGRAAVGSPGRTKVYILDEVHMLSAGASNALLKTLEEPPDHVCFVLATTDPQKVLPTIRSRTQHYEFSLLSAAELEEYVRWIIADAELDVDDAVISQVVRAGRGSARDTLSALDMAVASGGVVDSDAPLDELLAALENDDVGAALIAVNDTLSAGREARVFAEQVVAVMRDAFLVSVHATLDHLTESDRAELESVASRLGARRLTHGLEEIGSALVDMRNAAEPRIPLEVAIIRLCRVNEPAATAPAAASVTAEPPSAPAPAAAAPPAAPARDAMAEEPEDDSLPEGATGPAAVREMLRQQQAASAPASPSAASAPAPQPEPRPATRPAAPPTPPPPAPPAAPQAPPPAVPPEPPAADTAPPPEPEPAPSPAAGGITVDELTRVFDEHVQAALRPLTKAIYATGYFVAIEDSTAVFSLPNAPAIERAERERSAVEAALSAQLGSPMTLRLVSGAPKPDGAAGPSNAGSGSTPTPAATPQAEEEVDLSELRQADDVAGSGADRVTQAFPGSVVIDSEGESGL